MYDRYPHGKMVTREYYRVTIENKGITMTKIVELIAELENAESAMSVASSMLHAVREKIIRALSPIQRGDTTDFTVDGKKYQVKVTSVQIARAGRANHKIVAYGNIIQKDGTETTERIEAEYPIG